MVAVYKEHPLMATEKEIDENRSVLLERTETWRAYQQRFMPTVIARVLSSPLRDPENETLYLPSDFTASEREELLLVKIADEEANLREGQAFDIILQLRSVVKHLAAIRGLKMKNAKGQKENTRAFTKIARAQFICDHVLETYTCARAALESLKCLDDETTRRRYPVLTQDSLQRKSTTDKKARGETYHTDGGLWTSGGRFDFPATASGSQGAQTLDVQLPAQGVIDSPIPP
jgi:hypothetical protein